MLIVGINYAPEPVGIGPYTQGLAEALVAEGAKVEAIVAKPYYPQWRTADGYAGGGWHHADEAGVTLTRCPIYVPSIPSGLRRIVHLASFAAAALPFALRAALRPRAERPQLVVAIAPALLSVVAAWLAARLAGASCGSMCRISRLRQRWRPG